MVSQIHVDRKGNTRNKRLESVFKLTKNNRKSADEHHFQRYETCFGAHECKNEQDRDVFGTVPNIEC